MVEKRKIIVTQDGSYLKREIQIDNMGKSIRLVLFEMKKDKFGKLLHREWICSMFVPIEKKQEFITAFNEV